MHAYKTKEPHPSFKKDWPVLVKTLLVMLNMDYSFPKYTVYLFGMNKNVYDPILVISD